MKEEERKMEIERVRRKRGTIRGTTTRLLNQIDGEMTKPDPDMDNLSTFLDMLAVEEESLLGLDSAIEQLTPLDDLENEIETTEDYKQRVISFKSRAQRMIKRKEAQHQAPTHQRVSDANSADSFTHSTGNRLIEKLIIDKYNGDVSRWQELWSQYETTIHTNDALCKREKFTYLKTYLSGAAAKVVAGLMLTDANYDSAIALLQSRFGRKDLVISAHMSRLLNLNPVKKSSDVHALRQLYDECEFQIRSLESLGVCPPLMEAYYVQF